MEGFDDPGVFFSDNFSVDDNQSDLQYYLEVNIEDVGSFDENLADKIYKQPSEHLPVFEEATKEVADELTAPRPEGEEQVEDIQIMLSSDAHPSDLRALKSEVVSRLVKIPGIIVSASGIKAKATKIAIQCRSCSNVIPNLQVKPGLEGYVMPRKCNTEQAGRPKCPLDPYFIMPDKCHCVDFQVLKLQELPDGIPQGEIPRHMHLYCDRYLCERVVPGNRVYILGIYSIKKMMSKPSRRDGRERAITGVRAAYMRVLGIQLDTEGIGASGCSNVTAEEEDLFRRMAASPNIYERLASSIAPSIYGAIDIKKAIACLLFGGSRKRMPDGLTRRGDINVLLLGDPGTAKSQLLKFVERVAPIARNFVMEGGAMVLADGGVVCIDEFDKMREDDRVAIHEAMEQQTISIAKAGITTTLNSRCSVLAAANSVFGRWDETKGEDNIDFLPTILSRFDMIFIVKDEHDRQRDMVSSSSLLYIFNREYCICRCGPRLNQDAGEKLKRRYVMMRCGASQHEKEADKKSSIPITVRQLEAVIRISESLAKMQLQPFATETHVDEALRLFQVSTLDAAMSGNLAGAEGFTTEEEHEMLARIEKQLKRRFAIGTQVSQQNIIQDFTHQQYPERAVLKVIQAMIRRGQLQHRMQRKMLYRIS
ncbi:hypothetical protein NQ314_010311 [Rhamnusium bicolor]|uniref:DNA replication licensing factor MCM5 n=1 Tax=Rhamnusium bicolor TaxID=1586634 RepID=A0AAV8XTJ5_9CUCU|nr:hypothetical protein NQ314_010311 [Rhamnusium bicolor]